MMVVMMLFEPLRAPCSAPGEWINCPASFLATTSLNDKKWLSGRIIITLRVRVIQPPYINSCILSAWLLCPLARVLLRISARNFLASGGTHNAARTRCIPLDLFMLLVKREMLVLPLCLLTNKRRAWPVISECSEWVVFKICTSNRCLWYIARRFLSLRSVVLWSPHPIVITRAATSHLTYARIRSERTLAALVSMQFISMLRRSLTSVLLAVGTLLVLLLIWRCAYPGVARSSRHYTQDIYNSTLGVCTWLTRSPPQRVTKS